MAKEIKIVRIIARLNIGGPAQNAIFLTKGLEKYGFSTSLVAGRLDAYEGDMFYLAKENNVAVNYIPDLGRDINFIKDIKAFYKLFLLIKEVKPDIVHTHTAKAGTLGRIAGWLYKITRDRDVCLVHTFHGHIFHGYFGSLETNWFTIIERILSRITDRLITVSDAVKRELVESKIAKPEKISIVPLGLDLDKLLSLPLEEQNEHVSVGIIGRLVPVKNHHFFLRTIRRFFDISHINGKKVKFMIIGDGDLADELKKESAELGLSDAVTFTGWQRDLPLIYSRLSIACLTSLNEGTPVSLIEAMAAGRPVIATDVGGVKDIVDKERGILVDSGDIDGFVNALIQLISDKELRNKLGVEGREFVRNKFGKERLINDMVLFYESLLKEARR